MALSLEKYWEERMIQFVARVYHGILGLNKILAFSAAVIPHVSCWASLYPSLDLSFPICTIRKLKRDDLK